MNTPFIAALPEPVLQTASTLGRHRHEALRSQCLENYRRLVAEFRSGKGTLRVSFRHLVGPMPMGGLGQSIYPYPARLLRQIPRFVLSVADLVEPGDSVLDPFCGSGTVLAEARSAGISAWGIDSNPLARLLSKVRTTWVDPAELERAGSDVLQRAKHRRSYTEPQVVNVDLWYTTVARSALGRLAASIAEAQVDEGLRQCLQLALATAADSASARDRRIPVPVRRKDWDQWRSAQHSGDVWTAFEQALSRIATTAASLTREGPAVSVDGQDARTAWETFERGVSPSIPRPRLVVTSPPYGAAQKYVRSSSLALGWAGLASTADLPLLEQATIGREHIRRPESDDLSAPNVSTQEAVNAIAAIRPDRAAIYAAYFRDMHAAIASFARVLQPGGHTVIVAGPNLVAGLSIQTHLLLAEIAQEQGMSLILAVEDQIRGRSLLTTRAGSAQPMQAETVIVLRKERW